MAALAPSDYDPVLRRQSLRNRAGKRMNQIHSRYVIVGAGAMGSAAAYYLAKRGAQVLLVEQFRVGHDRGSSHGAARITRHSYADPHCAGLMPEAFRAWKSLEADAGECLYVRTGGVTFGPSTTGYVARVASNLDSLGVPHRLMTANELAHAHPAFRLPEGYEAVFEPDAGLLAASRAVAAEVALARRLGGERTQVREECPIRRIDLDAETPTLVADNLTITADRLIVTAGAWVKHLLPALGVALRPTRQQVLYFRPAEPASFAIGRFPVFIYKGAAELDEFYGMPACLGCDVTVARHGGPDVDPNTEDRAISEEYQGVVRAFLERHIPSLASAPISLTETCLYTVAPEDRFVLGPLPGRPDVIVASPCSGHGFKFSNLIGRALADLALEGQTPIDIVPWQVPDLRPSGAE
ncbi:MAG TPA: N-methyl-L-tryptophan oxidase [Isosphaeraceae bacterium]|nr:N-methyl-L-tryptophan oxidase [Isosphaeraceae bacterium]